MTLPLAHIVRQFDLPSPVALLLAALVAMPAAAQDHDLEITDAPDVTSMVPANRLSPDIKIGADFGDASVPDQVRRGVPNPVYARFYVNGVNEFTDASGSAQIRFHWRHAMAGEMPPALGAPGAGWHEMPGSPMSVTWAGGEILLLTTTWPTDYTPPGDTFLTWTPAAAGDWFHVRAEVVHGPDMDAGDNVAVSLYDSIPGLADVDVLLVLDLSGSMLTYMYAGDTYLSHAISRAQAFVASMSESHRVAVVGFGGCLAGNVDDVWPAAPAVMRPELANLFNKLAASGAIGGLSIPNTGCLTPMGVGVDRAIQVLNASAVPDRKKTILLLTDGYENSGTTRACTYTNPVAPCLGNPVTAHLVSDDVRVFSIALGAAAWTECLVCLADQAGGQWYAPAGPGIDLAQVYLDMQQVISGDDLYRADRGTTGGGDDDYETFFEGFDDLLYFVLQTDRLDAEVDLELRPPGGPWQNADAVPGSHVERGRGFVVARVEEPREGAWGYRVIGEESQDYLAAVRSDRVGTQLAVDVDTNGRVGSPIHVRAEVTFRGEPRDVDRLIATVQVPVGGSLESRLRRLGREWLRERRIYPVDPFDSRRGDLSPRSAFIAKLTDGDPQKLMRSETVELTLEPRGDGTFVGVFWQPVEVAGDYLVTVALREKKADREWSRSVRLAAGEIDFKRSFAELIELKEPVGDDLRWLVRVYPTDRDGNAVTDPRLLEAMEVAVRGAEPMARPTIGFDSAVELWLKATKGTPRLESVLVGGRKLRIEERR
jgi:hypothetical protein